MPVDLSEIESFKRQRGPQCGICRLLAESDDAVMREKLVAALDDKRFGGADIGRWLRAKGYEIQSLTVNRHRGGECLGGRS